MGLLKKITGSLFGGKDLMRGYDQGIGVQREMFNTARGDLAPYRDFGASYLPQIRNLVANRTRPTPESVMQSPGYQFRLKEGTRALDNSAIARGGLLSGNHLRDILSYGQDYASNEYDKAVTRDEGMFQNDFARLMNLANLGYGAAGGSAGIAQNAGNSLANLYAQRGQAGAEVAQFPWKLAAKGIGAYLGMG